MPHTILDCDGTQVNLHYIDGELPDEQYPFALAWPNNERFASEMVEVAERMYHSESKEDQEIIDSPGLHLMVDVIYPKRDPFMVQTTKNIIYSIMCSNRADDPYFSIRRNFIAYMKELDKKEYKVIGCVIFISRKNFTFVINNDKTFSGYAIPFLEDEVADKNNAENNLYNARGMYVMKSSPECYNMSLMVSVDSPEMRLEKFKAFRDSVYMIREKYYIPKDRFFIGVFTSYPKNLAFDDGHTFNDIDLNNLICNITECDNNDVYGTIYGVVHESFDIEDKKIEPNRTHFIHLNVINTESIIITYDRKTIGIYSAQHGWREGVKKNIPNDYI